MTDTSESDSPGRSPEDTYNKLRRVPYEEACAIYGMACIYLRSDAPTEELNKAAGPALKVAGWTVESLTEESVRLHRISRIGRDTDGIC